MAANEQHKREMNRRKAACVGMTVKLTEGLINGADPKCVREFNGVQQGVYASFVLQPQAGLRLTRSTFINCTCGILFFIWKDNSQIFKYVLIDFNTFSIAKR